MIMSDVNDDTVSVILSAIDEKFKEQSNTIDSKLGAISEHMDHKIAVAIENFETIIDRRLEPIQESIRTIKDDMSAIKAAVKDLNNEVQNHEQRIENLEHVTA